jgi:hypothetical protein
MVNEMVNNGNNKSCGFDDAMVSYIYDEITTADRRKFETHLVGCSACTEEFAEISGARFSVFEWQKEVFAELPTPEIVIPYAKVQKLEAEHVGFFSGLSGLFGGYGMPLTAGAAVLICLGIGFAALTLIRGDDQIASNVVVEQPKLPQNNASEKPLVEKEQAIVNSGENIGANDVEKSTPSPRELKPTKAVVESKRSRPVKQFTVETADRITRPQTPTKKAPALSNFDEASDRSLRLTDLFDDEIGSIR